MNALRHRRIASGNIHLHAVECGDPRQPLLLFLHGFPESWTSWRPMLAAFGNDYYCVALDNRGFGDSDKPTDVDAYAMAHIVGDIAAVIGACTDRPATLVAHDWGGIAAWHFAARYPELLSRLVALNAPHPALFQRALLTDAAQRTASGYIARLRDDGAEARLMALGLETFWTSLFGAHFARGAISAEDKATCLAQWAKPGALTAMLNWYRASSLVVPTPDAPLSVDGSGDIEPLATINTPTLVIWGVQDTLLLPVLLDGLPQVVADMRVDRISDAGHGLVHEQPEAICALIQDWLAARS
jgi:pimeloyl-ACP methyl ester carboxylesterase